MLYFILVNETVKVDHPMRTLLFDSRRIRGKEKKHALGSGKTVRLMPWKSKCTRGELNPA
jgi:hypothetical protein